MENDGEINPYEATNTKIPTLSFNKVRIRGGPEEIRTLDLSDANRTLSQLSYRPIAFIFLYYITNLEFVNSKNKPQCERAIPKTK